VISADATSIPHCRDHWPVPAPSSPPPSARSPGLYGSAEAAVASSSPAPITLRTAAHFLIFSLWAIQEPLVRGANQPSSANRVRDLIRRGSRLFPHQSDQTAYLTPIALDNGGEFGALGDRHADTLNNHIIDLVCAIVVDQPPVHSRG
jgi:hypothetical protein